MGEGDTKDRIARTAIGLFNERGTAAVSTNHIAEEMGISPGNLYYHFRNKEEIIRAVFGRLDDHWERSYALRSEEAPTLNDVHAMVEETFSGLWGYRFFYRELGALTRRDAALARRFRALRERGLAGTEDLLRAFVEAGVLQEIGDEAAVSRLAKMLMLIAEFWLPFEETGSDTPQRGPTREGVELMMQVLEPYLADGEPAGVAGRATGSGAHIRGGGGR